jgi:ubiquinone/menaquinone biosynthesis C-methylase UbiE
MPVTHERFKWAVELLKVKPTQNILEIGCGAGLLAEEIASKLTTGKVIGIDKSLSMLGKAKKRNKEFIEKGISEFINADFLNSQLPTKFFDTVTAFNVNVFSKNPVRELELIKRSIKPKGNLYVFYQAPFEIKLTDAKPIQQKLLENSFEIVDMQLKKLKPTSAFCIIAAPKK